MRLADLQRAFQSRVLHGTHDIDAEVPGSAGFDTAARLDIYRHAYRERLSAALAVTYPALRAVLGEAQFAELIASFATRFPSSHASIRYFGGELHAYIAATMSGTKARVLSDLARWEWALCEVFDAADASALGQADLAGIAPTHWPTLRFELSPSLRRLGLQTNAVQWWRACVNDARRPRHWRCVKPGEWMLWRTNLKTYFRPLPRAEALAIDAIAGGQCFAAVCEILMPFHTQSSAPAHAATLLLRWLNDGWIVGAQRTEI